MNVKQLLAILEDDSIAWKAAYKDCCDGEGMDLCDKCATREGGIDDYRDMIMQRIEKLKKGRGK